MGFLFAAMQDFKRREVDNWLNLFLFFSGFLFIISRVFLFDEISFLINFIFLVCFMFGLSYLFYFGKVFAGGDCKLLFAITPLLVSFDFLGSFINVFFFVVALLFLGALYGLFYILYLFIKDSRKNFKDFYLILKKFKWILLLFLFLSFIGFFVKNLFLFFAMILFLFLIFLISKVVEKNSLIKSVYSKDLREGDWLKDNIFYKNKTIKSSFEGLSSKDIMFLKSYKKKIAIKDGIPFAPVFFLAWILYYFRGSFMEFLVLIFGVQNLVLALVF